MGFGIAALLVCIGWADFEQSAASLGSEAVHHVGYVVGSLVAAASGLACTPPAWPRTGILPPRSEAHCSIVRDLVAVDLAC